MGTPAFVQRALTQDLVYWASPQNDGTGSLTFATAVEIKCRCEYKIEQVIDDKGEETVSRARIYVDQELDEGGYVYLGTLDDSNVESDPVPSTTIGSMRIISFEKVPSLVSGKYLYKANVNMK